MKPKTKRSFSAECHAAMYIHMHRMPGYMDTTIVKQGVLGTTHEAFFPVAGVRVLQPSTATGESRISPLGLCVFWRGNIHAYLTLSLADSLLFQPEISILRLSTSPTSGRQYIRPEPISDIWLKSSPQYTAIHNDGYFVEGSAGCVFVYEWHVFSYSFYSFNRIYRTSSIPYTRLFFSIGASLVEVPSLYRLSWVHEHVIEIVLVALLPPIFLSHLGLKGKSKWRSR
jgi:hypothetical protein